MFMQFMQPCRRFNACCVLDLYLCNFVPADYLACQSVQNPNTQPLFNIPLMQDTSGSSTNEHSIQTVPEYSSTPERRISFEESEEPKVDKEATPIAEPHQSSAPIPGHVKPHPLTVIPILFKEATIDSPSFRAHCEHIHIQFQEVDSWINQLVQRMGVIDKSLDKVRHSVNSFIGLFMPTFIYTNVIDQSHVALVLERFAEVQSLQWTNIMYESRRQHAHMVKVYKLFRNGPLQKYNNARVRFCQAQDAYDESLQQYLGLPRKTEATKVRDGAGQIFKYHSRYLKESLNYCDAIAELQYQLNILFVDAMAKHFKADAPSMIPVEKRMEIGFDLYRLASCAETYQSGARLHSNGAKRAKSSFLAELARSSPSKDANDYAAVPEEWLENPALVVDPRINELFGWVSIKAQPQGRKGYLWVRCWAFVKDGVFGWLERSPSRTSVQESPKISVLLCSLKPASEDRNFCFQITTPKFPIFVQVESLVELKKWISVFTNSQHRTMADKVQSNSTIVPPQWLEVTAVRTASVFNNRTDESEEHVKQSDEVTSEIAEQLENFVHATSLGMAVNNEDNPWSAGRAAQTLAPLLIRCQPLSTSRTTEALIASHYFAPTQVPNALVGNYAGSVNWAMINSKYTEGKTTVDYPAWYPPYLQYHDIEIRSSYGFCMPYDGPTDLVVLVARVFTKVKENLFVSCQMYCTCKSVYLLQYSLGYTGFVEFSLRDIVSIEALSSAAGLDELRLTVKHSGDYCEIDIKCHVDPGTVLQRRMQFLFDNTRASEPVGTQQAIPVLENMGKEYRDQFEALIFDRERTIKRGILEAVQETNYDYTQREVQQSIPVQPVQRPNLISKNTETSQVDNDNLMLSGEREYNVKPKILFTIFFGDKSPLFAADAKTKDSLKWHFENSKIQRLLQYKGQGSGAFGKAVTYTQTLERRDENYFYVVSERSASNVLYSCRFYVELKYVIALTTTGTSVMVYYGLVFESGGSIGQAFLKKFLTEMLGKRVDDELNTLDRLVTNLPRKPDDPMSFDISQFGRVVISTTVGKAQDVTRSQQGGPVRLNYLLFKFVWLQTIDFKASLRKLVVNLARFIFSNRLLILIAAVSLVLNSILVTKTGLDAWRGYWEVNKVEKYVDRLQLSPKSGSVFHRAVFSKDIDQKLAKGQVLSSIASPENQCYDSFRRFVSLEPFEYDSPLNAWTMDPDTQEIIESVVRFRLDLALERSQLLAQLHTLDNKETARLEIEWKKWLMFELSKCNEAQILMPKSNDTMLKDSFYKYCGTCAAAAQQIM